MSGKKRYLIIVCGPTASGKTSLAIHLAQQYATEILSSDSRQFFKEMNIGTAKPSAEELAVVKHHFINSLSIHTVYNAGDFEREGLKLLAQLFLQHRVVIMAGGSGLYIKAICEGLNSYPEVSPSIRRQLNLAFQHKGLAYLQEELLKLDPVYYKQVDTNNHRRMIRALEICKGTGRAFSSFQTQNKTERDFEVIKLGIFWERWQLYQGINERVDTMLSQGLEQEARTLYAYRRLNALQTVGYKEFFAYFDGVTSKEKAIERIKRNSRRYAKRQMTWFNKQGDIKWFKAPLDLSAVVDYLNATIY